MPYGEFRCWGLFSRADDKLYARGRGHSEEEFFDQVKYVGYTLKDYYITEVDPLPYGEHPFTPKEMPKLGNPWEK